ncbi:multiubiquitin domain-containing protein [Fredinandcohnia sp. QZ13]|uniref:multiubiquitin domain-containing protein n=1 Tax=Fredinandcohnia sp. QZ13 TaxID=3073144 RepID=UPI0028533F6C|nr:multiubiquitin domain-containing protein [Fredinandcohnia sp. QZ13]MDR4888368.1 multiubiquitin domain-containing protein [Fredinandcohnia sp. QZ13]
MNKDKGKVFNLIINGRMKEVDEKKLSYQQVINLAFGQVVPTPNIVFTVKYSKGKHEDKGSMVEGDVITVKEGMIINVTRTDKS